MRIPGTCSNTSRVCDVHVPFFGLNINFRGVNAMVIQHVSVAGTGAHIFFCCSVRWARFSTSHLRLVHVDNLNDGRRYDMVGMCRDSWNHFKRLKHEVSTWKEKLQVIPSRKLTCQWNIIILKGDASSFVVDFPLPC